MIAHWDEVEGRERGSEPIAGRWTALGSAAGSAGVGLNRIELAEGRLSTPPHVHRREEEIFFVLGGRGTLWQDGRTCDVRPDDAVVHVPSGGAHTLIGGEGGLDVLVFGPRLSGENAFLPRAGMAWVSGRGVRVDERHPWAIEAELGAPAGEPAERPANVVNADEVEGDFGGIVKALGREGGARTTGLNRVALPPRAEGAPPHCHSAQEELFVVLDGEGTLELWAPPLPGEPLQAEPRETHPLRRGHVVSRPPATRVPHSLRAGAAGLTYLAYGTREPNDICWYPRSNKVYLRGVGMIARLEPLEYGDGERE